jgi:hypothetical protein
LAKKPRLDLVRYFTMRHAVVGWLLSAEEALNAFMN